MIICYFVFDEIRLLSSESDNVRLYFLNSFKNQLAILAMYSLPLMGYLSLSAMDVEARVNQLSYAGATTLERHFMPQAAKLFKNRTGIEFSITGGNTGPGIQALIEGTVDIAGAGRYLKAQEKATGLTEHLLGWDALYVVVHRDNPVETLSLEQLRDIISGRVDNWQTVGGPDLAIMVISSPPGSGMRSSVRKTVLQKLNFTGQEVISPIVRDADRLVAQFPTAISVLSASMVDIEDVKVLNINEVPPSPQNVNIGSYPLVKPLLLVTKKAPTKEVAEFVALAQSLDGQLIIADKFFSATPVADMPRVEDQNKPRKR